MFGTFRLFLASAVVVAHMKANAFGLYWGVTAVVCFYAVSGYAMAALIESAYPTLRRAPAFYLDRFTRLAPQYYFYMAAFAVLVLGFGYSMRTAPAGPNPLGVFADLLILPMALFPYGVWNPPLWTIGLELLFYLLLPLMLINRATLYVTAVIAALAWIAATQAGDHAGAYRMLPGPLVFFLIGVAVQRGERALFAALVLMFVVDGIAIAVAGKLPDLTELFLGAAVACAAVPLLAGLRRSALDDALGNASYGCYLAHWGFVMVFEQHWGEPAFVIAAVLGSIACGWLTYRLVEKPTIPWRRSLRRYSRRTAAIA